MATRTVMDEGQVEALMAYLRSAPMPFTVTVNKGKLRSAEQNRLQRKWVLEVAEQRMDMTPEEVRGYCKLHFGVPILRHQNEAWRVKYDQIVKPLPYEAKLSLMQEPFDFGVTRIMTTKQKAQYLDAVHAHWTAQGIILTTPEAMQ